MKTIKFANGIEVRIAVGKRYSDLTRSTYTYPIYKCSYGNTWFRTHMRTEALDWIKEISGQIAVKKIEQDELRANTLKFAEELAKDVGIDWKFVSDEETDEETDKEINE